MAVLGHALDCLSFFLPLNHLWRGQHGTAALVESSTIALRDSLCAKGKPRKPLVWWLSTASAYWPASALPLSIRLHPCAYTCLLVLNCSISACLASTPAMLALPQLLEQLQCRLQISDGIRPLSHLFSAPAASAASLTVNNLEFTQGLSARSGVVCMMSGMWEGL